MPTAIAIHWTEPTLSFVVVQDGRVAACSDLSLNARQEPAVIGRELSEALAPFLPGRAKVIVALGRGALQWQHLSLPPCPTDELPDVVRLQSDRDLDSTDEDLGFDFLPLMGNEQTPYQVLTVALAASELAKIRQVFRIANLTLERIVPLAAGWPALTKQATKTARLGNVKPGNAQPGTEIFVAPVFLPAVASEATLWATRAGRVVLFRQFQLLASDDPTASAAAIAGELRRTLLALSQDYDIREATVSFVGNQHRQLAELASALDEQLEVAVQSLDVTAQHPSFPAEETASMPALPLAGLAIDESEGNQPLVDLLHPHQRPQAQLNVRTYALAAAAGILLAALFGWLSYAKLHAPLKRAAEDQAELTLLKEPLESLIQYEQRAAAIRDWQADAPNLLVHLQQISQCLRPEALDADGFSVDQDVVLESFGLDKRGLTIDALARSSHAVQPLESRLRESGYRPQRGKSDPSETIKDYPWHFNSMIAITAASDSASLEHAETKQSENKSSTADAVSDATIKEPQS